VFALALASGMVSPVAAAPQPGQMPAPLGERLDFIAAGAPLDDLAVAVVKDGQPLLLRAYGSATLTHLFEIGALLEQSPGAGVFRFGPRERLRLATGSAARIVPGLDPWLTVAVTLWRSTGAATPHGWVFQPNDFMITRFIDLATGRYFGDATLDSAMDGLGVYFDGTQGASLVAGSYFGHPRAKRAGTLPGSPDSLVDLYPDDHLHIVLLTRSGGAAADVALRHLADTLAANVFFPSNAANEAYGNHFAGTYAGQRVSGEAVTIEIVATPDGPHVRLPGQPDSKLLSSEPGSLMYPLAADSHTLLVLGTVNRQETPLTVQVDGQPQIDLALVVPRR
jgi:hypothetical protein